MEALSACWKVFKLVWCIQVTSRCAEGVLERTGTLIGPVAISPEKEVPQRATAGHSTQQPSRYVYKWKYVKNKDTGVMERTIRLRLVLRGFMDLDVVETFSGTAGTERQILKGQVGEGGR